jgi:hypothetical protein
MFICLELMYAVKDIAQRACEAYQAPGKEVFAMAERRKLSALAGSRQQAPEESIGRPTEPAPPATPVSEKAEKGKRGRPAGKRSDPEFQPTTVLLRKITKKAAIRKLEDADERKDLSNLIEQLLTGWIKQQDKADKTVVHCTDSIFL